MSDIKLIKEDVSISIMDDTECESCGCTATHNVTLDLRGNGCGVNIGYFCETCAVESQKRIQATLPSEAETEEVASLQQKLDAATDELKKVREALDGLAYRTHSITGVPCFCDSLPGAPVGNIHEPACLAAQSALNKQEGK